MKGYIFGGCGRITFFHDQIHSGLYDFCLCLIKHCFLLAQVNTCIIALYTSDVNVYPVRIGLLLNQVFRVFCGYPVAVASIWQLPAVL